MAKLRTTVGQLMVNDAMPTDIRDYSRALDKGGINKLLIQLAEKHPEDYAEIVQRLGNIAHHVAYTSGGNSFGIKHLKKPAIIKKLQAQLREEVDAIEDDDTLTPAEKKQYVIQAIATAAATQRKKLLPLALEEENPLATQVVAGARGSEGNLASLIGSDLMYQDHRGDYIPVPILRSYSEGLSPAEYWAAGYGARKGIIDAKMATQDAGYLGKQLAQVTHRLVITGDDDENEPETLRGLPTDINDADNEGALLAAPAGGYDKNTILTPKLINAIKKQGIKRILVRSPISSSAVDGGLYAKDVGIREYGRLPVRGEQVGITAAQALSEPISQGMLSSKHSGGAIGAAKSIGGFQLINQLINVPKTYHGGATHSQLDGSVHAIEAAPAGGTYVTINNERHYVPTGLDLKVKLGDKLEAGDILSGGIPNPAAITMHKGVGEGRKYFTEVFLDALRSSGIRAHRRNVELLSRGLINHVKLTGELGDYGPEDIIPYNLLEAHYQPREGSSRVLPARALNKYLEKPYLHYSIGTRIRPSVLKDLNEFGVNEVEVHPEPPPFDFDMLGASENLHHDPDWMTKMFGSDLSRHLLRDTQRGAVSDELGTSFVPSLARGLDFGARGKVITPPSAVSPILR